MREAVLGWLIEALFGSLLLGCRARARAQIQGGAKVLRANRCHRVAVGVLALIPPAFLLGLGPTPAGFALFFPALLLLLPLLNEAFGTAIFYDARGVGYASWFRRKRWPWSALVRLETSPGANGVYLVFQDGGHLEVPRHFDGARELVEEARARLAAKTLGDVGLEDLEKPFL